MSLKLVILLCMISYALAGFYPYYHSPPTTIIKKIIQEVPASQPAEAPANYQFQYEVHEESTGDIKRQHEEAKDGKIQGEYSLVEPDGQFRRIVTYTADDVHGFQADVRKEPWNHGKIQPQTTIIKKIIAPAPWAYQTW
ncbi:hypothetical protein PVAND_006480 [Polypedilum vanderplanki]|uniref:Cuticle protein n=1 Tax=Polypedilum vanderplanki TaxID=319348 RepID=A0A9J6C509_POLVA|nr:hypothetical protein PVAND_006480 [Polypedilum vanderplanki]